MKPKFKNAFFTFLIVVAFSISWLTIEFVYNFFVGHYPLVFYNNGAGWRYFDPLMMVGEFIVIGIMFATTLTSYKNRWFMK